MVDTTFEEARRCPRCEQPGTEIGQKTGRVRGATRGAVFHEIACMNERCRWHNTTWVVQTNPDGTVPQAQTERREKFFHRLPERNQEDIDRQMNALLNQQLQRNQEV